MCRQGRPQGGGRQQGTLALHWKMTAAHVRERQYKKTQKNLFRFTFTLSR